MVKLNLEIQKNKNPERKCDDCGKNIDLDEEFYQYQIKGEGYKLCGDCNDKRLCTHVTQRLS